MENPCKFINGKQVASRLSIHPNSVRRVMAAAGVRTLAIPGCYPKYHVDDVEALLVPVRAGRQQAETVAS